MVDFSHLHGMSSMLDNSPRSTFDGGGGRESFPLPPLEGARCRHDPASCRDPCCEPCCRGLSRSDSLRRDMPALHGMEGPDMALQTSDASRLHVYDTPELTPHLSRFEDLKTTLERSTLGLSNTPLSLNTFSRLATSLGISPENPALPPHRHNALSLNSILCSQAAEDEELKGTAMSFRERMQLLRDPAARGDMRHGGCTQQGLSISQATYLNWQEELKEVKSKVAAGMNPTRDQVLKGLSPRTTSVQSDLSPRKELCTSTYQSTTVRSTMWSAGPPDPVLEETNVPAIEAPEVKDVASDNGVEDASSEENLVFLDASDSVPPEEDAGCPPQQQVSVGADKAVPGTLNYAYVHSVFHTSETHEEAILFRMHTHLSPICRPEQDRSEDELMETPTASPREGQPTDSEALPPIEDAKPPFSEEMPPIEDAKTLISEEAPPIEEAKTSITKETPPIAEETPPIGKGTCSIVEETHQELTDVQGTTNIPETENKGSDQELIELMDNAKLYEDTVALCAIKEESDTTGTAPSSPEAALTPSPSGSQCRVCQPGSSSSRASPSESPTPTGAQQCVSTTTVHTPRVLLEAMERCLISTATAPLLSPPCPEERPEVCEAVPPDVSDEELAGSNEFEDACDDILCPDEVGVQTDSPDEAQTSTQTGSQTCIQINSQAGTQTATQTGRSLIVIRKDKVCVSQVRENQMFGNQVREETCVSQISENQVFGDQVREETCVSQVCENQVFGDQVSGEEYVRQVCENQVFGDQMSGEEYVSQMYGDREFGDRERGEACLSQVCGNQVFGDQVRAEQVCDGRMLEEQWKRPSPDQPTEWDLCYLRLQPEENRDSCQDEAETLSPGEEESEECSPRLSLFSDDTPRLPLTMNGKVVFPELVARAGAAPDVGHEPVIGVRGQIYKPNLRLFDKVKHFAKTCTPLTRSLDDMGPGKIEVTDTLNTILLIRLTCVKCGAPGAPPLLRCAKGHWLCAACRPLAEHARRPACRCPRCDAPAAPSRIMDVISRSLRYRCRYEKDGCRGHERMSLEEREDHETSCDYRQVQCYVGDCPWRGRWSRQKNHVLAHHSDGAVQTQWYRKVPLHAPAVTHGTRSAEVVLLGASDLVFVFLVHAQCFLGGLRFLVQSLNEEGLSRYQYRLRFSANSHAELEARGVALGPEADVDLELRKGRSFRLDASMFGESSETPGGAFETLISLEKVAAARGPGSGVDDGVHFTKVLPPK